MTHQVTTYRLLEGFAMLIEHCGEELRITTAGATRRPVLGDLPQAA